MAENATAADVTEARSFRCKSVVQMIGDRMIARLPEESSAKLPSRGQVSVAGTANGQPFETVLEPDGRRGHWLDLRGVVAANSSFREGADIALDFAPAQDWPEPDVPDDFTTALSEASDISGLWTDITPMARWEWVRWICAAKNPETRARRIEVSISKLRTGKRRPCCFDLASCTDPELSKSGKLVVE